MPTANHVLLQRTTLTTNATTVTLSGIPTTGYTDLKLVMSARTTYAGAQSDYVIVKFNGTTTTYTGRLLIGTGTSTSSITPSGWRWFAEVNSDGQTAKTFGNTEIYIPNYSVVGIQKSYSTDSVSESNAVTTESELFAGLWDGTGAINTIEMASGNSGNFMAGSSFSLYGIANATTIPVSAPKADGGDIVKTDGTYWYHAFTGSGIFKPQVNLTADVLVVAGGGGGTYGAYSGAGGGAGGLLQFTSQSLTTNSYTCTIGAGGTAGQTSTNGANSLFGSLSPAIGGGGGGGTGTGSAGNNGKNGGSGGGGSTNDSSTQTFGGTGVAGPPRQGYDGGGNGNFGVSPYPSGAGGGAGAVGGTAPNGTTSGSGGVGATSTLINSIGAACSLGQLSGGSYYFAGGGGGCNGNATSGASGGLGGGGTGGTSSHGTPNTGGGGGASGTTISGNGGSGVIIIRYPVQE